jgi:uncharacterized protein YwqG
LDVHFANAVFARLLCAVLIAHRFNLTTTKIRSTKAYLMRNLETLTSSITVPGVHAVSVHASSKSHFGGSPNLPSSISWPEWRGNKLSFLARISLHELQRTQQIDWLPENGALLFFYDTDEQPWGFDPKDRGGCAVFLVPDLEEPLTDSADKLEHVFFQHMSIAFRSINTFPSAERAQVEALSMSDEEHDEYWDLLDTPFQGLPKHQITGMPSPVQGDCMELECQLVSNGLYCGNSSGYDDPRAKGLEAGSQDWRLLLQLDTDDDAGIMWGDCGTLYFWVRAQDAAEGRFENTWLILQCS